MSETLLETAEQRAIITGLDIDHPGRPEPGLRQSGSKQILPRHTPEDPPARPSGDPGGEQRRRRAVDRAIAATADLVQGAECKTTAWERGVDRRQAER